MSQKSLAKAKALGGGAPRDRTQPLPGSLHKVTGYGTLTIYQIAASPFWYMRYFEDKKIVRRSLKVADKKEAIKAAKKVFVEIKHAKINKLPFTRSSGFEVCARGLLQEVEARVARGEASKEKLQYDRARLEADLMPYFGKYEIADIDYACISGYLNTLSKPGRQLSTNSLKIHLSHIKTIMRYAQRVGVITALPAFPKLKTVDKPRPWLSGPEYAALHAVCRANIGKEFKRPSAAGHPPRKITITEELYDLVIFMTNAFIRPGDVKLLQHKHVAIVRSPHVYLRLTYPPTKGHSNPVVTMPEAVNVYERLLARQQAAGYGGPEDYLFQPEHPNNRDYALRQLSRQFDQLLNEAKLKHDPNGEARTLYSLRHTSIMFRLTKGDKVELLTLARNARTSYDMIDRFYAKHLVGEMNVAMLQSLAEPLKKAKRIKKALDAATEGDDPDGNDTIDKA